MAEFKYLLGAHMSIAGGVEKAIYRGAEIGCTAIQIFTGSNRQWSFKEFSPNEIDAFKEAQKKTGIHDVISHASYLINLCSSTPQIREKSVRALELEIVRCAQLGIKYVVLHPGSGNPEEMSLKYIEEGLHKIIERDNTNVVILLENMAGQGSSVAYTFEQLAQLLKSFKNTKKIGICFDTCHAWAAGYDFSNPINYKKMWTVFDEIIGIEQVKAIHLNDSVKALGSRIDRHQHIGRGAIGLEAFKLLVNDKKLSHVPKILETPKGENELKDDKENLDILKSLLRT